MTKFINPGLAKTSRRNVLRGSVLAGAAAVTGAGALARQRPVPFNNVNATSAKLYKAAVSRRPTAQPNLLICPVIPA